MRKTRKILLMALVIVLAIGSLAACKSSGTSGSGEGIAGETKEENQEPEAYTELPAVTNLADAATLDEVCNAMEEAGLSNVETFKTWVQDFNGAVGAEAGLAGPWSAPGANAFDMGKCMDGWEKTFNYPDVDCRMTAFLLSRGVLTAAMTDEEYTGTYLMFDVEAIENTPKYDVLKEDLKTFTTLFGDKDLTEGQDPKTAFESRWNEYGFSFRSEKASLLSIVFYDEYFKQTFVGHTGILINEGDSYLFVEKLAFEQPFQVTRGKTVEDIIEVIKARPEYQGDEQGPFFYVNGNLLT